MKGKSFIKNSVKIVLCILLFLVLVQGVQAAENFIANPASVNCGNVGGTSVIMNNPDGSQYGMCNFPNGTSCEEWALFRSEGCKPNIIPQTTVTYVPLVADFTATPNSGKLPLTIRLTDTSSGFPTAWEWYICPLQSTDCRNQGFGIGPQALYMQPVVDPLNDYSYNLITDTFCQVNRNINPLNDVKVLMKVINGSRSSETTKTIHIESESNPTISSFTATPSSGPAPLTVQFTDTSSNNPTSWNWYFGEGKGSIGDETSYYQKNPSHTYTISGIHTVTMSARGSTTCNPTTATTQITVYAPLGPTSTTTTTTAVPNATVTTTATTAPTPTVTTVPTTATIVTTYTTPIPSPTTKATVKVTVTKATPWPTDTPTQSTPLGIEIGIIATIGAALIVMRRK